jgi:hypothetical protein
MGQQGSSLGILEDIMTAQPLDHPKAFNPLDSPVGPGGFFQLLALGLTGFLALCLFLAL